MIVGVSAPDVVIRADPYPVRRGEDILAPRFKEIAFLVENEHRRLRFSVEKIDSVFGVAGDAASVADASS